MKITLWAFTIIILNILVMLITCQDESLMNNRIITKSYPRKIKKLQILNPRKFIKISSGETKKRISKKNIVKNEGYTFFPAIVSQSDQEVAVGPFLQLEHDIKPKVRVKKVLPDYLFTLARGKRSVTKVGEVGNGKDFRRRRNQNKKGTRKEDKKGNKKEDKKGNKKGNKKEDKKGNKKDKNGKNKKGLKIVININSPHVNHNSSKLKQKTKNNTEPTTKLLPNTVKGSKKTKGRSLRKGKRSEKQKLRRQKIKRQENIEKNLRKKNGQRGKKDSRRLIAGKDALIADYPYVVSIQKGGQHWCAGALLNQRLVITTANCIWKSDRISRLRIRAGSRHADRGGQLAKIQEVMKHPKWSIRRNPDNDVALILLDRNIKFSDKVHSLDLPNRAMLPAFDDAWVTSWGAERRDGIFDNSQFTLQVYHSRLMDHAKCNNVTQRFGVRVSENFICLTQTGRRAPCTRDTGAPAVSDGILWGLASWGIRKLCGTERFPAMFSYLASPSNLDFITNSTHSLMSEHRFYPFPDRFDVKRAETTTVSTVRGVDYM